MLKRLRNLLGRRGTATPTKPAATEIDSGHPDDVGDRPPVHRGPNVVHRPIPVADIDPDAMKILRRLSRFNHTAYLVGGCVRDLLLERRPKDFDIGTTATPRQVKRLFRNCRIIGKRFRLAHIYFQNGKILEVATFRARNVDDDGDASTDEGDLLIRDDNIFGTPEEDALRRDFTINALFYDANDENVLDHADGLGDLRRRMVRTIGDPEIRFREDPIRILRAIRFAAGLGFRIEPSTLDALERTRNLIPKAAAPRILEEINRFCRAGGARASFDMLRELGVFGVILPEFAEGYREDPGAWKFLVDLLDAMDRRTSRGEEVRTAEILAALLLPLVASRIGWKEDGSVKRKPQTDIRELADEMLRPMALRLRMARRDQEQCRQILMTLHRMVPATRLRRATKESILRRPVTPSCLWILEAMARRSGGAFDSALETWQTALKESPPAPPRPERRRDGRDDAKTGEGAPRRRKRRRPTRRKPSSARDRDGGGGTPKEDMPPPWDDGYFFAALPTVPEMEAENDRDRHGGGPPTPEETPTAPRADAGSRSDDETEASPPKPRRKRRRRRRSRPKGGGGAKKTDEPAAS
jgi:poly(A) polymerase